MAPCKVFSRYTAYKRAMEACSFCYSLTWERMSSTPASVNIRTAVASRSRSPLAKPCSCSVTVSLAVTSQLHQVQSHRSAAHCATVSRECLLRRYRCCGASHILSACHGPAARGMSAYRPAACRLSSNMAAGKHRSDLVSRVKEGQQPSLLHHLENTLPLLRGGVHPSGVVSTCMQEHH